MRPTRDFWLYLKILWDLGGPVGMLIYWGRGELDTKIKQAFWRRGRYTESRDS